MSDNNSGKGPWGNKSGQNSPWGKPKNTSGQGQKNQGGSNGPDTPDMDEMLRKLQDKMHGMFGGNGSQKPPRDGGSGGDAPNFPVGKILILVIAIYMLSGFYRVLPEENAVVLTFGEWTSTKSEPGLGYHLPWPVQTVEKVNVTFQRRMEIGFRDQAPRRGATQPSGNGADIPGESLMLTGDENIIDIDFVVLWKISDAGKYLFAIKDPENTIKKVAESAMREIIGRTKIQQALTQSRAQIEQATRDLMQKMMDTYQSGIAINAVQLQQVDPPSTVVDAFDDVQRARADMERARNQGEAYRNDILPRARGQAEEIIQQAEAYKEEVMNRAKGDTERFNSIYRSYVKDKTITSSRMYIETLEDILGRTEKIILDGQGGANGVLPYLPLDRLKPEAQRNSTQNSGNR